MTWDFAEANPFSDSSGNWMAMITWVRKSVEHLPTAGQGTAIQRDASGCGSQRGRWCQRILRITPLFPTRDFDFFFVWLRRNLSDVWPDECATLLTPKADELVANRYRAGSKEAAEEHFESGMAEFMADVRANHHPDVPSTIYYVQSDRDQGWRGSVDWLGDIPSGGG